MAMRKIICSQTNSLALGITLNEAKNAQVAKDYHEEQLRLAAVDTAQKLKGYTATIAVKCGSEGRLFGAVTNAEVARAISRDMGIDIDKKKISIEQVKVLGNYTAKLKLHPTVSLNIAVRVIASN